MIQAQPHSRRAWLGLTLAIVAAAIAACNDEASWRAPTAPVVGTSPAPPTTTASPSSFFGPMTILRADPEGDCLVDAIYRTGLASTEFTLGLFPWTDGTWTGAFYGSDFLAVPDTGGCSATLIRQGDGVLTIDLDRNCGVPYAEWPVAATCGAPETLVTPRQLVVPVPSGGPDQRIRGEGILRIDRWRGEVSLPPIEIRAEFDLSRRTP